MIIIGGLFSSDAVSNNIIPCILFDIVFARSSLSILEFLEIISGNEHGDLVSIECFHSRGQDLFKFIGTKESGCIRKDFNSHRIGLGHQHGRRFIVLGHQYGRRDVM